MKYVTTIIMSLLLVGLVWGSNRTVLVEEFSASN